MLKKNMGTIPQAVRIPQGISELSVNKMRALMYWMDWNEAILEKGGQLQGFCNHKLGFDEVVGQQGCRIREEEKDIKIFYREN